MSGTVFRFEMRVYWEDTDAGGVVFYANYLKFFERARTEWLRARGVSQERLRVDGGAMFIVADTSVHYRSPARLDDCLSVSVEVLEARSASMLIAQQAHCILGDERRLLAEGRIRIACVAPGTFRPCRIPTELLNLMA